MASKIISMRALRCLATAAPRIAKPVHYTTLRTLRQPSSSFQLSAIPATRRYSVEASATAVEPPDFLNEAELHIFNKLKEGLSPTKLEVQDVSGGCGSMYALDIVSAEFQGLPIVRQHRLVNKILSEEIKTWHGVQMKTKAP